MSVVLIFILQYISRGAPQKGIPGVPGATELEAAIKRLTPAEVLARRTNLQHGPAFGG